MGVLFFVCQCVSLSGVSLLFAVCRLLCCPLCCCCCSLLCSAVFCCLLCFVVVCCCRCCLCLCLVCLCCLLFVCFSAVTFAAAVPCSVLLLFVICCLTLQPGKDMVRLTSVGVGSRSAIPSLKSFFLRQRWDDRRVASDHQARV